MNSKCSVNVRLTLHFMKRPIKNTFNFVYSASRVDERKKKKRGYGICNPYFTLDPQNGRDYFKMKMESLFMMISLMTEIFLSFCLSRQGTECATLSSTHQTLPYSLLLMIQSSLTVEIKHGWQCLEGGTLHL